MYDICQNVLKFYTISGVFRAQMVKKELFSIQENKLAENLGMTKYALLMKAH